VLASIVPRLRNTVLNHYFVRVVSSNQAGVCGIPLMWLTPTHPTPNRLNMMTLPTTTSGIPSIGLGIQPVKRF
jgi:hypothetical protein